MPLDLAVAREAIYGRLTAAPFVAELLGVASEKDPLVGYYSSWIQASFLSGLGCDLGQGWHFGVPGAPDEIGRLLRTR